MFKRNKKVYFVILEFRYSLIVVNATGQKFSLKLAPNVSLVRKSFCTAIYFKYGTKTSIPIIQAVHMKAE